MNVRLALVALVSALLLAPAGKAEDENLEIRSFTLEHVSVREANAIIRSVLDIRKTAIDELRNELILRDDPATLSRAVDLLRQVDQPRPRWSARLVATTAHGDVEIRTLPLIGTATWSARGPLSSQDGISVRLEPREIQERVLLGFQLEVSASSTTEPGAFRRNADELHSLGSGDSFDALVITPPFAQAAVAKLVGAEHPVRSLRIEIQRQDAPKSRRTPR